MNRAKSLFKIFLNNHPKWRDICGTYLSHSVKNIRAIYILLLKCKVKKYYIKFISNSNLSTFAFEKYFNRFNKNHFIVSTLTFVQSVFHIIFKTY